MNKLECMKTFSKRRLSVVKVGVTFLLVGGLLLVSGCDNEYDDLKGFVAKTKEESVGRIEKLPEFKPYASIDYSVVEERSPFADVKPVARSVIEKGKPDTGRSREVLEAYSLDSLAVVGVYDDSDQYWGLVQAPTGVLHRVRAGNFMGSNYGEVISIDKDGITLAETIMDAVDGWVKREAELSLLVDE